MPTFDLHRLPCGCCTSCLPASCMSHTLAVLPAADEQAQLKTAGCAAWQHHTDHSQWVRGQQRACHRQFARRAHRERRRSRQQGWKQLRNSKQLKKGVIKQHRQIRQLHSTQAQQAQQIGQLDIGLHSVATQSAARLAVLENEVMEGSIQFMKLKSPATACSRAQQLLQSLACVITDLRGQMQVVCPHLDSNTSSMFLYFWASAL